MILRLSHSRFLSFSRHPWGGSPYPKTSSPKGHLCLGGLDRFSLAKGLFRSLSGSKSDSQTARLTLSSCQIRVVGYFLKKLVTRGKRPCQGRGSNGNNGAVVGTATYTGTNYPTGQHGVILCPVEVVSDPNNTYQVDNTNPVLTYVRFGLWDNAFDITDPSSPVVKNDNSESANFVGSDSRRFYFRVYDPSATTTTVTVEWYTQTSVGGIDDDGKGPSHSGVDTITLTETGANTGVFVSKALMLVADEVDNAQVTNTGLLGGGNVAEGVADHRLRRAALGDKMCYSYTPAATGSTKQTFFLPIFGGSEPVKTMTVQVANCYHQSNDQSNVPPQSDATVQAIENSVKARLAVAGINVNFLYHYNSTADQISIYGTDLGGVDLTSVTVDSGNSMGDQGKIATLVKAHYPGAASNTIFLILIQSFKSGQTGQPASVLGEAYTKGTVDETSTYAPSLYCSFVAFSGTLGGSSTTCVPAHELGHQLTDPSETYNGDYGINNIESGNHYGGIDYFQDLMKNGAADPFPGSVTGSKRLWDDASHAYAHIPITKQIDFMRQSPLLQ